MDLYQLRYFLEVARELSFTRAAENLHVTPSAVSRSIALLEASVRRKLFTRTKRHVALTANGSVLLARAQRIFDEVEQAKLDLAGKSKEPAMLRLGSREMITHYLLPGPLLEFKARFPSTRFGIHELEPEAMAAALKRDQLDIGFYYTPLTDPGLESRCLGRLRSHVYASKIYLKSVPRPKGLRGLLGLPFIAPRYFGADPASPSPDGFPDHRYPRNIQYEAEFLETHRRFVLSGLAVGVLPDLVMKAEQKRGEVVALDGPPIYREIHWFRRKNRVLPKAADVLLAAVRKTIRDLGPAKR